MTWLKTLLRTLKKNLLRIIVLGFVMTIGIGFTTGVGALPSMMRSTLNQLCYDNNAPDVDLKGDINSTPTEEGNEVQKKLNGIFDKVDYFSSFDFKLKDASDVEWNTRAYFTDLAVENGALKNRVNDKLTLVDGNWPSKSDEVVVEQAGTAIKETREFKVGDTIDMSSNLVDDGNSDYSSLFSCLMPNTTNPTNKTYKVVGIVSSPLYFSQNADKSWHGYDTQRGDEGKVQQIIYFDNNQSAFNPYTQKSDAIKDFFPITEAYLTKSSIHTNKISYLSKDYQNTIQDIIRYQIYSDYSESIENIFSSIDNDGYYNLSFIPLYGMIRAGPEKPLEEMGNFGFSLFREISYRVDKIAIIFPVMFVAIIALVTFITFSKLIMDERSIMGCYSTLGYSKTKIKLKYLIIGLLCCIIGITLGLLIGWFAFTPVLWAGMGSVYFTPSFSGVPSGFYLIYGIVSIVAVLAATIIIVLVMTYRTLKEKPAALLMLKSPKPGKKILLEHIPIIWNHLKFKYKSTYRNIFRYVVNFILTVVAVAFSVVLVLAGFGLNDALISGKDSLNMKEMIAPIVAIVIVCASMLSVLVLYNLTNISIQSRQREIATLKVLGYRNNEVVGYIYRELFILSLIGMVIGLPVGYFTVDFIFKYLQMGSVQDVKWYSWLATVGVTLTCIGIADVLLFKKIINVDMNGSLKAIE